jgi:hypothetical protein
MDVFLVWAGIRGAETETLDGVSGGGDTGEELRTDFSKAFDSIEGGGTSIFVAHIEMCEERGLL